MRSHWVDLNERDRLTYRVMSAFLDGRLQARATVEWALRRQPHEAVKRLALLALIDSPQGSSMQEPWRSAWRLIEESWNRPMGASHASTAIYDIQRRLRVGERSGSLVDAIIELVVPRLKVEQFSLLRLQFQKLPKQPRSVDDLFSTRLTSGEIVDPDMLDLGSLTDRPFLMSLAHSLDAAVGRGLDIARRIGRDGERTPWQLGGLRRVHYVRPPQRAAEEHEPDEFHKGISPAVKLLHAVVSRLVDVDVSSAIEFVSHWETRRSPVYLRLWAALSRSSQVTSANDLGPFLLSLDDEHFWNLHAYPEIAELRARRFGEFDDRQQQMIAARIRKRPPRSQWPKKTDTAGVTKGRLYWALRELRRIEIAGASLPSSAKAWLGANIHEFPDLVHMSQLYEGFLTLRKAQWVAPNPDYQYDMLVGEERLKCLEAALASPPGGWNDSPAQRAVDWIRYQQNQLQVLTDLESIQDGGSVFPKVWEQFGGAHTPTEEQDGNTAQRDLAMEGSRVLTLLAKLAPATIAQAIDGISRWLSAWEKQIVGLPEGFKVWLTLWPIAVEVTNAQEPVKEEIPFDAVAQPPDDDERMDLDTSNNPAGRLVGVFLATWRSLEGDVRPFQTGSVLRAMRDTIIAAAGRSGSIVRYRMIEVLPYLLRADPQWANNNVITPLLSDDLEAIDLWHAIARRVHFSDTLKIIGEPMAARATDQRLRRETRGSLAFSLVIECLHAFREQRESAVPYPRITQMIRSLDDEVRAYTAEAVQRFVRDVSLSREADRPSPLPEEVFRAAAAPFLRQVWPQERSLTTPGVSRAFARLPATANEAFAEAVDAVERFLVPFECWSMVDYGLYGEEDGKRKLLSIDNHAKVEAFLRLLSNTIGRGEGSAIPNDLGDALDQIQNVAPSLVRNQEFRRLATVARRI